MNFALVDEDPVFRTAPFTVVATCAAGAPVAFRVGPTDDVPGPGAGAVPVLPFQS